MIRNHKRYFLLKSTNISSFVWIDGEDMSQLYAGRSYNSVNSAIEMYKEESEFFAFHFSASLYKWLAEDGKVEYNPRQNHDEGNVHMISHEEVQKLTQEEINSLCIG